MKLYDTRSKRVAKMHSPEQPHPEQTRAFRVASLKGWNYALAHKEEIVELILARYPTKKTKEELLFEASREFAQAIPGYRRVLERFPSDRLAQMMLQAIPASEFA